MTIQLESLKKQLAEQKDRHSDATREKQVAATASRPRKEINPLKPLPPRCRNVKNMTLFRGQREIQVLFLGRGHTQGDTVVFLPETKKIVCTGDLMESRCV